MKEDELIKRLSALNQVGVSARKMAESTGISGLTFSRILNGNYKRGMKDTTKERLELYLKQVTDTLNLKN